jgi:glycosyltransferase involved in cell wall biosynthesis
VVLTTIAAEGMYLAHGVNAMIADDAAGLAEAILAIRADPVLWTRLSDNGLDNIRRHFSVEHARATLRSALGADTP